MKHAFLGLVNFFTNPTIKLESHRKLFDVIWCLLRTISRLWINVAKDPPP